ncbi:MAG: nucleotidyltransferase domain-containing protein [Acidobacteriota bacterium]
MVDSKVGELLNRLRTGLEELYRERLAGMFLFGSYARGEASDESDVDILIVLEQLEDYGLEIERTGNLVSSLSIELDTSISRVFVSSRDWREADSPFLSHVRQHAQAA